MYYFCNLNNEDVPWCNGNTYDFGSYIPSSSLGGITKIKVKVNNIL